MVRLGVRTDKWEIAQEANFNSLMVRLGASSRHQYGGCGVEFQFLNGAIGSYLYLFLLLCLRNFNSLMVRLGGGGTGGGAVTVNGFQFLNGAIGSVVTSAIRPVVVSISIP